MIIDGKECSLSHTTSEVRDGVTVTVKHYVDGEGRPVGGMQGEALPLPPDYLEEPPDYRELRRRAYPPIGDQLDVIWKALGYLQMKKKINLVTEADLLMGRILNVKKKYPKPE